MGYRISESSNSFGDYIVEVYFDNGEKHTMLYPEGTKPSKEELFKDIQRIEFKVVGV